METTGKSTRKDILTCNVKDGSKAKANNLASNDTSKQKRNLLIRMLNQQQKQD
jgi:hypothetical protein